jgi:predicted lipoprotein with Yx(FWY)xxD motif
MPSLIDLRRRIRSVKSTQQVTKAMKMVSAAKLRRAQERVLAARPYAAMFRQLLSDVSAAAAGNEQAGAHPLLALRPENRVLLVMFTSDRGQGSRCSGDCAAAWPPYIVRSAPTVVSGAKPGLAGTTRRSDGKLQATYAGHPVYYYEGDRSPGEVNCQAAVEFGGYWYVLRSNGKAVH